MSFFAPDAAPGRIGEVLTRIVAGYRLTRYPAIAATRIRRHGWRLLLSIGSPTNSARVSWVVVFALHHVLRADVLEAKDFVVEVQAVCIHLEAPRQLITGLRVELELRVEVVVARRAGCAVDLRVGLGFLVALAVKDRIAVGIVNVRKVLV